METTVTSFNQDSIWPTMLSGLGQVPDQPKMVLINAYTFYA